MRLSFNIDGWSSVSAGLMSQPAAGKRCSASPTDLVSSDVKTSPRQPKRRTTEAPANDFEGCLNHVNQSHRAPDSASTNIKPNSEKPSEASARPILDSNPVMAASTAQAGAANSGIQTMADSSSVTTLIQSGADGATATNTQDCAELSQSLLGDAPIDASTSQSDATLILSGHVRPFPSSAAETPEANALDEQRPTGPQLAVAYDNEKIDVNQDRARIESYAVELPDSQSAAIEQNTPGSSASTQLAQQVAALQQPQNHSVRSSKARSQDELLQAAHVDSSKDVPVLETEAGAPSLVSHLSELQSHSRAPSDVTDSLPSTQEQPGRSRVSELHEVNRAPTEAQPGWWAGDAEAATLRPRAAVDQTRQIPNAGEQIAHEIVSRADAVLRGGRTEFSMRLEPPELGTVRIHLTATDHTITARFMVANESVRHIVTSQLDSLRQSLADAGMSLQRFDISHGGQGGTHGQAQQDLWRGTTLREHSWSVRHVAAPQVTSGAVPKGRIDVIV